VTDQGSFPPLSCARMAASEPPPPIQLTPAPEIPLPLSAAEDWGWVVCVICGRWGRWVNPFTWKGQP
jgi:hypothetical protein